MSAAMARLQSETVLSPVIDTSTSSFRDSSRAGQTRTLDRFDPETSIIVRPIREEEKEIYRNGDTTLRVAPRGNTPGVDFETYATGRPQRTQRGEHTHGHFVHSILKDTWSVGAVSRRAHHHHHGQKDWQHTTEKRAFVKSLLIKPTYPTAQAVEANARWLTLSKRGQTHRRRNKYGLGVAPPGTKLTGAPDWMLKDGDDDADFDETDFDDRNQKPKSSIRVLHVLSSSGVVSVKHVVVLRPGASCHAHGSSADKRVARAIWRNADKQLVSKDGKLPGAEWRSAHFESRGEKKENVQNRNGQPTPGRFIRESHPTYGVGKDTECEFGSASQTVSRSKLGNTLHETRHLTRRTFRSGLEIFDAAKTTKTKKGVVNDNSPSSAAVVLAAKSVPSLPSSEILSVGVALHTLLGPPRKMPQQAGIGSGGGGLAVAVETGRRRRDSKEGNPKKSERTLAANESLAAHIARLGALSASFNDRQRAMVGRGVAEARLTIKHEQSWVKG